MALFSKEPEHNASPEHSHEPPPSLVSLATNSLDEENVASARETTPNLREASAALRKPVETNAYLDSGTKINGQLTFEGLAQPCTRARYSRVPAVRVSFFFSVSVLPTESW
jgi:hypothetical protein